jgi:hypothetical protein
MTNGADSIATLYANDARKKAALTDSTDAMILLYEWASIPADAIPHGHEGLPCFPLSI